MKGFVENTELAHHHKRVFEMDGDVLRPLVLYWEKEQWTAAINLFERTDGLCNQDYAGILLDTLPGKLRELANEIARFNRKRKSDNWLGGVPK